jgi:hypothetical protein
MANKRRTTRLTVSKKRGVPKILRDDNRTPTDPTAVLVPTKRSGISLRIPSSKPKEVSRELVIS